MQPSGGVARATLPTSRSAVGNRSRGRAGDPSRIGGSPEHSGGGRGVSSKSRAARLVARGPPLWEECGLGEGARAPGLHREGKPTRAPRPGGLGSKGRPPARSPARPRTATPSTPQLQPRVGAGRGSPAGGRGSAYLPWASRMAACDSAGTWPPPPSPGLETWRAGTKMAAPPNFHCYFGHSSSYFLGARLPPCDGGGTGTRLRHGGGRAEGERGREGWEGSAAPPGERAGRRAGGEGSAEGRQGAGAAGPEPGPERGRSADRAGRGHFRGRNLPAPLQCVGPRRRPGGSGRWVAAEAAG